jgi:ATP-binding cassette subfamily B protein
MSDLDGFDDDDGPRGAKRATIGHILLYLWHRWSSQPVRLAGFLLLFLLAVACDLALPVAAGLLVTQLEAGPAAGQAGAIAAYSTFCLIAAGFYLFRNLAARQWTPFAAQNMKAIITSGFADVQRFSADWHANTFAGATVRRVSRAMWAYDTISDNIAWFVIPAVFVLVGLTVITALQWPLVGLFLGVMIFSYLASAIAWSKFYIAPKQRLSNAADTRIGASLADAVGANPTVKAFGAEQREEARFTAIAEDWRAKANEAWMRSTNAWAFQNVLLFVLQTGLIGLVVREWSLGRATAGDATFALASFFVILGYLRNLGETIQMLQRGFADIEDAVAYSREPAQVVDPPTAARFRPGAGEIRFDHVGFGYSGQDSPLYRDFSLTIAPGETVALVGPTGSGKSTFVKLVQRLYDVDGGVISIDGQDVRSVTQQSLRASIALVPQDPALFHRSLRENIAYARPDASLDEVMEAAKRARAHEFIGRLPKGYDTEVGERGVKLSGGERQRVALARAFLADCPILILDEATSSLDNETERDVQAAMAELKQGRTTIIIAHRLSTVREADRILVFDMGRIVEQGSHASLIEAGGLYARLAALSTGEELASAPLAGAA